MTVSPTAPESASTSALVTTAPPASSTSWLVSRDLLQRTALLGAGVLLAVAAASAGTHSGLAARELDRIERDRLATTLATLNDWQGDRPWPSLRWAGLSVATNRAGEAATAGVRKNSDLPRDPQEAIALLKRMDRRWLEVDLARQRLTAWEGRRAIRTVVVSTGKASTPTHRGVWPIYIKLRSTRMRGPGYDVPNVPYTMYYDGGYGIHGAFWHNSFGTPVSHGCTNLTVGQARWFFNWASVGTPVVVR